MGEDDNSGPFANESFELPQRVRDGISEMHERWANRLHWSEVSFHKDYIDGRLGILIELERVPGQLHSSEPEAARGAKRHPLERFDNLSIGAQKMHCGHSGTASGDADSPVFVSVIKARQTPEGIPGPVFVSRQSDNEFLRIVSGCYYSLTRGFVAHQTIMGRESGVFILCTAVEPHEFPKRMVKSRPKAMGGVPENEGDVSGHFFAEADFGHSHIRVQAVLDTEGIWVSLDKGGDCGLKLRDVLVGPF